MQSRNTVWYIVIQKNIKWVKQYNRNLKTAKVHLAKTRLNIIPSLIANQWIHTYKLNRSRAHFLVLNKKKIKKEKFIIHNHDNPCKTTHRYSGWFNCQKEQLWGTTINVKEKWLKLLQGRLLLRFWIWPLEPQLDMAWCTFVTYRNQFHIIYLHYPNIFVLPHLIQWIKIAIIT